MASNIQTKLNLEEIDKNSMVPEMRQIINANFRKIQEKLTYFKIEDLDLDMQSLADEIDTLLKITETLAQKADIRILAPVATSGSYRDLTNKPKITIYWNNDETVN